jgi:hypothetical protein
MTDRQVLSIEDLEHQHRGLDAELMALTRRAYLTPEEQRAARELKKRKLSAKDRIVALRRIIRG